MRMRTRIAIVLICLAVALSGASLAYAGSHSTNGVAGSMPAYYDGNLRTINFMFYPAKAQTTLHNRNGQFNTIYQSDPGLPGGLPFISVLDAVPADGMNPIWEEVQVTFNPGFTPRQLFSDNEVLAAAAAGEVTLTDTEEMYRCSVIGKP